SEEKAGRRAAGPGVPPAVPASRTGPAAPQRRPVQHPGRIPAAPRPGRPRLPPSGRGGGREPCRRPPAAPPWRRPSGRRSPPAYRVAGAGLGPAFNPAPRTWWRGAAPRERPRYRILRSPRQVETDRELGDHAATNTATGKLLHRVRRSPVGAE